MAFQYSSLMQPRITPVELPPVAAAKSFAICLEMASPQKSITSSPFGVCSFAPMGRSRTARTSSYGLSTPYRPDTIRRCDWQYFWSLSSKSCAPSALPPISSRACFGGRRSKALNRSTWDSAIFLLRPMRSSRSAALFFRSTSSRLSVRLNSWMYVWMEHEVSGFRFSSAAGARRVRMLDLLFSPARSALVASFIDIPPPLP
mmetsp:Transcript_25558/g.67585  ORF Transcript_25558/g.67585 Transcript_25558/m.67585 type:complete len:202 (-) Transcript_25558:12-617(-)